MTYKADKHFGISAYAVSRSVEAIQTEIMKYGPVEAAFTVYADFPSYKSGIINPLELNSCFLFVFYLECQACCSVRTVYISCKFLFTFIKSRFCVSKKLDSLHIGRTNHLVVMAKYYGPQCYAFGFAKRGIVNVHKVDTGVIVKEVMMKNLT